MSPLTRTQPRRRQQDLEVLYKISNIINTTLDRQEVLRAVLKEVVRLTGATSGSISRLDPERGILDIETAINIPARAWKRLKLHLGVGVTGWVAYKGEPLRVNDVRRDTHYVSIKSDVRSELAVPMLIRGKVIGVINVDSTRKGAFTEDDERLLTAVAEQSAKVIETARLHEALKSYSSQMEAVFEIGRRLASPVPVESVLSLVVEEGRRLLGVDVCAFVELEPGDPPTLAMRAQAGATGSWQELPQLRARDSLLASVVRQRAAVSIHDLRNRAPFWGGHLPKDEDYRSLLGVPVVYQDEMLGVLVVLTGLPRQFNEFERNLLQLLADQAAASISSARRQDRMLSLEETLHRAERFSLLGTMAAELAHEIRNPVTIINLLLDSIAEQSAENPTVSGDLAIVREKVDRIARIVDQALDVARNREPEFEPVSINALVEDALLFLHYKLAKRRVEASARLTPDLPQVEAVRGHLQQVLLNVLMNALEAAPAGTGKIAVRTEREYREELGDCIALSVSDNGPGIPRAEADSLFEPFFTTRPGGTGLGLFISRKLIAGHGGDIEFRSRPGRGSTFTVLIPLERTRSHKPET